MPVPSNRAAAAVVSILILFLALAATSLAQSSVPERPTGLTSTSISHDSVTIAWDDPSDTSITGYEILRRDRDVDASGVFTTINANTGSADTTYTDTTVEAERRYVYRVKAINANGSSPRSSYVNVDTPVATVETRIVPENTELPDTSQSNTDDCPSDAFINDDDDHPNQACADTEFLVEETAATGTINADRDVDWFGLDVEFGAYYAVTIVGTSDANVYRMAGLSIDGEADSYSTFPSPSYSCDTVCTFRYIIPIATNVDTVYIGVQANRSQTGDYSLTIEKAAKDEYYGNDLTEGADTTTGYLTYLPAFRNSPNWQIHRVYSYLTPHLTDVDGYNVDLEGGYTYKLSARAAHSETFIAGIRLDATTYGNQERVNESTIEYTPCDDELIYVESSFGDPPFSGWVPYPGWGDKYAILLSRRDFTPSLQGRPGTNYAVIPYNGESRQGPVNLTPSRCDGDTSWDDLTLQMEIDGTFVTLVNSTNPNDLPEGIRYDGKGNPTRLPMATEYVFRILDENSNELARTTVSVPDLRPQVSTTTQPEIAGVPSRVRTSTESSDDIINMAWNAVDNAVDYRIRILDASTGDTHEVGIGETNGTIVATSTGETSVRLSGVPASFANDRGYIQVAIKAVGHSTETPWSSPTLISRTIPTIQNARVNRPGQVKYSWEKPSWPRTHEVSVTYGAQTTIVGPGELIDDIMVHLGDTVVTVSGLPPATSYTLKMRGISGLQEHEWSNSITVEVEQ